MADSSWGPGWPNCQIDKYVTITTKSGIRLPVRKEIAPLMAELVTALEEARDKEFTVGWCWGASCRAISGTSTPSNHSWGLAADLDAPENPYMLASQHDDPHPLRKRFDNGKTLRSTMPLKASAIARKRGFRWGGDYETKPDPMHFEFMESVQQANARAAKLIIVETHVIVARKAAQDTKVLSPFFSDKRQLYAWAEKQFGPDDKMRELLDRGWNVRHATRKVAKDKAA